MKSNFDKICFKKFKALLKNFDETVYHITVNTIRRSYPDLAIQQSNKNIYNCFFIQYEFSKLGAKDQPPFLHENRRVICV
jgi:hypothetical protein